MFSEQEKRTIIQILTMIMEADLVIHPNEIKFINSLMNEFGLSKAEFDHMDMLDPDILKKEYSLFNSEKKEIAKELFLKMAKIDGCVHPMEIKIINRFIKD